MRDQYLHKVAADLQKPHMILDRTMDKRRKNLTIPLSSNTYKEDEFDLATIGGRLKWLLSEKGMSQADLARGIGVSENAISSVILGESKQPSAINTLRMCAFLEATYEWLLTGRGEPWREPAPQGDEGADELRRLYLSLPPAARDAILTTAKAFAVQSELTRETPEKVAK